MTENNNTPATQQAQPKNNLEKKMVTLQSVDAINIPTVPDIQHKFVNIYEQVHGGDGKVFYEQEKFFFQRIINENQKLAVCTKLSLYACFLEAAVNGISLDPKKKMCYITPSGVKVGDKWEQRASLELSPYGELYKRMLDGQIKYADNPKVVYEGDLFEPYDDEHGTRVKYMPKIPRVSNKIVACFIKITRADDTIDYKWLLPNDMERLAGYSLRKNSRGYKKKDANGKEIEPEANALYSSGADGQADAGFWEAKTIKHAFRNYPKMRIGTRATVIQTQKDDVDTDAMIYGSGEVAPMLTEANPINKAEPAQPEITPHEEVKEQTESKAPDPLTEVKQQSAKAAEEVINKPKSYL